MLAAAESRRARREKQRSKAHTITRWQSNSSKMSPMAITEPSAVPQPNGKAASKAWAPVRMSASVRQIGNRELPRGTT